MKCLVVGDDDCKIFDIIDVIKSASAKATLNENLTKISVALAGRINKAQETTEANQNDNINPFDSLVIVLLKWRERSIPRQATLSTLIDILREQNLDIVADSLTSRYHEHKGTVISKTIIRRRKDSIVEKLNEEEMKIKMQKDHITSNLPQLIDSLSYTPMLIALLQSQQILNSEQSSDLSSIPNHLKKAWTLFDYIKARLNPSEPMLYTKVVDVFDRERQGGVTYILKQVLQQK